MGQVSWPADQVWLWLVYFSGNAHNTPMGYSRAVAEAFSWQTVLKVSASLLAVVKIAVLSRLLNPSDFGVFSLVAIALGLTEAVTQTGVNVTIIRSTQTIRYYINSAWVIASIRGFLIGVVMVGVGLVLQRIMAEPQLLYLVSLAALVPVIKGFINPAIVAWQKNLQFARDTAYKMSLVVVEVGASIILVWITGSVVGWVLALVVTAVWEVVISLMFAFPKPRWQWQPGPGGEILRHAKGLSLTSILSYLSENADNLLLGRILGTYQLGLYQNAYALAHRATADFVRALHHGTFPVLSRVTDDPLRLRRAARRTMAVGLGLAVVGSLPLLIVPALVVLIILGQQWLDIIPILPFLVVAGVLEAVSIAAYSVLLATQKITLINTHLGVSVAAMIIFILLLAPSQGLVGGALAIMLSRLIALPVLGWALWPALGAAIRKKI